MALAPDLQDAVQCCGRDAQTLGHRNVVFYIFVHAILFHNGKNGKQRKKTVDAVAASLMLEGYLTRKRLEKQT